jgi:hypothetical protein
MDMQKFLTYLVKTGVILGFASFDPANDDEMHAAVWLFVAAYLGATLQVRELAQHPAFLGLGIALGLGAVAAHSIVRLAGQPLVLAGLASAQLGVPVAAATLGTESHLLKPGEPSALILAALITIAVAAIAGRVAPRALRAAG